MTVHRLRPVLRCVPSRFFNVLFQDEGTRLISAERNLFAMHCRSVVYDVKHIIGLSLKVPTPSELPVAQGAGAPTLEEEDEDEEPQLMSRVKDFAQFTTKAAGIFVVGIALITRVVDPT